MGVTMGLPLTLLVFNDAAIQSEVVAALASLDVDYDICPRRSRDADSLLAYNPAVVICDGDALAQMPEDDRALLRQVGVEVMLAYRPTSSQKLPGDLGQDVSDFLELPPEPRSLGQRITRAREIHRLRSTVTSTPSPQKVRQTSERLRAVSSRQAAAASAAPEKKPSRKSDLERLKSNLITIISHEFKTPLHLAAGYAGLLADGSLGTLNEPQDKAVQTVKRQLERLSDKLSDIERIAQLEMGLAIELREPVDVVQLLKNEIRGFEEGMRRKNLAVDLKIDAHLPSVPGSQDFLSDVFRRLIDNAIHYTESGGRITVSARLVRNGTGKPVIEASVSDTGRGIPAAMLPHLFDRFGEFRDIEHHSSRRSGLGLGLAIVRHLVEVHDGNISVASEPGRGSTFTVTLPAAT
jgi:signal transduction histidine kinase